MNVCSKCGIYEVHEKVYVKGTAEWTYVNGEGELLMCKSKIIAVANQKGGVGKTTTCQNLSHALLEMGMRVLAVDFDPQMNLTTSCLVDEEKLPPMNVSTLMERMLSDQILPPPENYIVHAGGLDILAGSKELARQEKILLTEMGTETFLRAVLAPLRNIYNFILIDTNRAASPLMVNALTAADSVLIPLTPEFFSVEGLSDMVTTILKTRRRLNPDLSFEGLLFTISDTRTNLYRQTRTEISEAFQGDIPIFETPIPRTVQVGEAIRRGLSVLQYAPGSPASAAFRVLAKEVIANAGFQNKTHQACEHFERTGCAGRSA